jgi:protein-arginine kinase activator protein McsA
MVRHLDLLLYNLHSYIFYGNESQSFILLYTLAELLKGDVLRSIKEKRCPYCGKKFKRRALVRRHLLSSSANCKSAFRADMTQVIGEYLRIRERIGAVNNGKLYYKFRGIPQPTFRNMDELCEWLKTNGIPEFIKS